MGAFSRKPRVNKTLISLKVVAFFVLSGISALHILNNRLPLVLGINFSEYRNITIIATFASILGPLIVGPLADRFAAKNPNNYGKSLRILTAVLLLITAILYACLFAVPAVKRGEPHQPLVSFGCDANGAVIFQQRCSEDNQCHHWRSKVGSVNLTRCTYTCQDPTQYENMYTPWLESIPTPAPSTEHSSEFDYEDESAAGVTESLRSRRNVPAVEQSSELGAAEVLSSEVKLRQKRALKSAPQKVYVEPPHLCMTGKNENGDTVVKQCHVYTDDTSSILVHTVMKAATNLENDTHSAEWCNYPLEGFQCQIPLQQANYMIQLKNNTECKPMIECQVIDPYDGKGSVLADSECVKIEGDLDATLAGYTTIRILGDIFALACLTLLNTAIVIAVRETSEGRGEICRQYACGAVGYVVLFCSLDLFFFDEKEGPEAMTVAMILVIVCFILGALVLLFATQMPLSPPEWWWHTKTGMLVYPMSAIRKYNLEIVFLTFMTILFGTYWGSIHSYLYWSYWGEYAAYFAGLLLILVMFLNVDKFIEFCGHSNIFITCCAIFIMRFTALSHKETEWLTNVMEILEPIHLGVIWITIILYMRHVMPRKFTASGQALAVIAFFGLGKGFGALIGLVHDGKKGVRSECEYVKFDWLAITACIISVSYFLIYNVILAPRCAAKPAHLTDVMSGTGSQNFPNGTGGTAGAGGNGSAGTAHNGAAAANGNGNSYSPLRIYHNERGKKGQFRY